MGMSTPSGGRSHVMSEINVTPMVDVMLVLLIIFMVATPAILAGVGQLPEGEYLKPRPEMNDRVVLGIDARGNYFLNDRPIRREDAFTLLQAEFAARPEDKVLFVKADRSVKYEEMLTAMKLARDAGARVVAAVTEQKPGTKSPEDE